ncbi:MAG: tetratricopeptide repeat protein [Chloroflexi bacterium]|nr:tetratricopeptide repeat protein [Chloroflexota bacterium]
MPEPIPQVILTIREINAPQPLFTVHVLLNDDVLASNRGLTISQSRTVRELSQQFSALFEQRAVPKLAQAAQQSLGDTLFAIWLADVWPTLHQRLHPNAPWQLVIASDVPAILNLPWELLRLPPGIFIGSHPLLRIRRFPQPEHALPERPRALPPRPLHVLFMACAPQDQAALDHEREEELLLSILAQSGAEATVDLADLGTFEELRDRISSFQPHIVHLTGHGVVAHQCPACDKINLGSDDRCRFCTEPIGETLAEGFFAFEDERGLTDLRSASEMALQLFVGSGVQCAFISGCQSGKAPPINALGGICQGLVGGGLPLAIGWTASIEDAIATQFAAVFYRTLSARQPIDRALSQARVSILKLCNQRGDPSWALPVLYAATTQDLIFDPEAAPVQPPRPQVVLRSLPGMTEGYAEHFVGRRRELQRLLPDLREGKLSTLIITGLGGAGKSTLATRLARKLEAEGWYPIAIPSTEQQPLSAATLLQRCGDAFRDAARQIKASGDDRLAKILEIAASAVDAPEVPVDRRLRDVVTTLNQGRFVLVLDNFEVNLDTQQQTILSQELAAFVAYLLSNLVGGSRAIITSRYLPKLGAPLPAIVREEKLADFPYAAFLKFLLRDPIVERRYRSGELAADLLRSAHNLLGGTPRFLEQLRELLKTITTNDLRDALRSIGFPAGASADVLQTMRDRYCESIITARLYAYLDPATQRALSQAAVYNIAVNLDGLAAVIGGSDAEAGAFVQRWQQYAFVYPDHERGAENLWSVYGVVRGWLLAPERISPDERTAAHLAAGDFLVNLEQQDREEELGLTWFACLEEARAQYLEAGAMDQARRVTGRLSGYLDRSGFYPELIRMNEELLEHEEHPASLSWIGQAHIVQSNYREAQEKLELALTLFQEIGDREGEAATWHNLATIDLHQGDYSAARDKYGHALTMRQTMRDQAREAITWHNLASLDLEIGDYPAARDKFQRALTMFQEVDDYGNEAATWHQLASIDLKQGDYSAARDKFQRSLAITQAIGERHGESATWHQLATLDVGMSDYSAAYDKFQRSLSISQTIGNRASEAATWYQLGLLAWQLGRQMEGTTLMALCFLIDQAIGHGNTESDFKLLSKMATQLSCTQQQLDALLQCVNEIYRADRGASLLRAAFPDTKLMQES